MYKETHSNAVEQNAVFQISLGITPAIYQAN